MLGVFVVTSKKLLELQSFYSEKQLTYNTRLLKIVIFLKKSDFFCLNQIFLILNIFHWFL